MFPVRRIWACATAASVLLGACAQDRLTGLPERPAGSPLTSASGVASLTSSGDVVGPLTYVRSTGKPVDQTSTFAADPGARYLIDINDDSTQGADGSVTLNGQVLLAPRTSSDSGARHIQVSIALLAENTLSVRLTGKPGSRLTISIRALGWRLLTPGGPMPLSAFAYAPALGAIFAASMNDYAAGALWRLDLATAQWSQVQAFNWPIGKYRKLIYDAPNHRLLTYWDGLGQVFAIPETGGSWTPIGSAGNSDQYYEAYAFLDPETDRLAVFGGYGFGTFKNSFWEWDTPSNAWVSVAQGAVSPDPRFGSEEVALDPAGHRAFLGQRHLGVTPGAYDDLWSLDLDTYTWTNLIPPYTGTGASGGSALVYVPSSHTLYRFGGSRSLYDFSPDSQFYYAKPDSIPVAWTPIPGAFPTPGPRVNSGFYYDAPRNRLVLVGGDGASDVWAYDLE